MARKLQPHLRGDTYYLRKTVPKRYRPVESRSEIWVSLDTDSLSEAEAKIRGVWDQTLAAWEARLAGDTSDAESRFAAARELAKVRGFRFLPPHRVAALPLEDLGKRMDAVPVRRDGKPDQKEAEAVLGGAERPEITVSRALDIYLEMTKDHVRGKNKNQQRIWLNGRKRPIANFIAAVGDIELKDISADDALDYREWWWQRITANNMSVSSANKDMTALSAILKTVNQKKRLGLTLPFSEISFREDGDNKRPAFSPDWIRDQLLAPGALSDLNTEARCLLLGMINTGYRPSEAEGLLAEHIRLDTDIPHIRFEPVGRSLKTPSSRRTIPLAGVSLEAFRECRDGFPRYREGAGVTNLINKFLRGHGLIPEGGGQTLYSLRHSFKDRCLDAGIDSEIRRRWMGHTSEDPDYGDGASLPYQMEQMLKVAI